MYSKKLRFPFGKEDFRQEKSFSTPCFLLKIKKGKTGNRFAIVISSRAVRKSHRRHFWKRIIADEIKKAPNLKTDFLVIVSKDVEKYSADNVRGEIKKITTKLIN